MEAYDTFSGKGLTMRTWIGLLLIAALACGVSSCGKGKPGGKKADGKLTIAVIPKSMGGDFWETVRKGCEQAQKELGIDMRYQGTQSETEIAEQKKIIENMVSLKVDGMCIAPLNFDASKGAVESVAAAKIPVVIFDSDVDSKSRVSFVATKNLRGGQIAAEHMIKLLGGKGNVLVLRYLQGTGSTEERAKGFIETAKAGGLTVLADPYPDDGSIVGCKKAATNALAKYVKDGKLEVDGVFACNLYSADGMRSALDDLRKSGVAVKGQFIGFDSSPDLVRAVQEDRCAALVVQNPHKMGYLAVKTLVQHLRGEKVEPSVDTGAELVTKDRLEKEKPIRELVGLKD